MKIELIIDVVTQLQKTSQRKARKLARLVLEFQGENNPIKKQKCHRKLYNYLYQLFQSQLSRETRGRLSDLNSSINEECYQIEQREKDGWSISTQGVVRREIIEDKIVVKNAIPRVYGMGFTLSEDLRETTEEKRKEVSFFAKNRIMLERISEMMDQKMEIVSGGYQLKNERSDKELVELLIDCLGYERIEQEKGKVKQKER